MHTVGFSRLLLRCTMDTSSLHDIAGRLLSGEHVVMLAPYGFGRSTAARAIVSELPKHVFIRTDPGMRPWSHTKLHVQNFAASLCSGRGVYIIDDFEVYFECDRGCSCSLVEVANCVKHRVSILVSCASQFSDKLSKVTRQFVVREFGSPTRGSNFIEKRAIELLQSDPPSFDRMLSIVSETGARLCDVLCAIAPELSGMDLNQYSRRTLSDARMKTASDCFSDREIAAYFLAMRCLCWAGCARSQRPRPIRPTKVSSRQGAQSVCNRRIRRDACSAFVTAGELAWASVPVHDPVDFPRVSPVSRHR